MIISLISLIVIIAYFILDEYLLLTVIFGASWIFAPKAFLDLATTLFMKFAYSRSLAREIPTKDALVALCKTLMTMYSSYTYKVTSLLDVGVLAICITLECYWTTGYIALSIFSRYLSANLAVDILHQLDTEHE